jgi:hypothetical protein
MRTTRKAPANPTTIDWRINNSADFSPDKENSFENQYVLAAHLAKIDKARV